MKKILSTLLALSLILLSSACGAKPPEPVPEGNSIPAKSSSSEAGNPAAEDVPYPDGNELRIKVPFKTGGALDVQVRLIGKYLADELGANIVVENVVGAGGQLGTTEYLGEAADTSTILLTDAWLTTMTPLITQVQYTLDDFAPIIDENTQLFCLFANPAKTGISSFEDLQEYGKNHRVIFGSGGAGTSLHVLQKSLLDQMGIESDIITQGNTSEGLVNLMAGTVDLCVSSFKDTADYVKNGDIVPILSFGEEAYSDDDAFSAGVPCAKEKGIDITYSNFYYFSIRKGTNPAIIEKLHHAFMNVYSNPAFISESSQMGFAPKGMASDEISTYLEEFTAMAQSTFTLE